METQTAPMVLDLDQSIRRSKGRTGRTFSATAKVSRKEMSELEAVAISQGKGFSEWCREVLLSAARGETVTPIFTEVIAIRQLLNATMLKVACGNKMHEEEFQTELQTIRATKHRAAAEMMQQYAAREKAR